MSTCSSCSYEKLKQREAELKISKQNSAILADSHLVLMKLAAGRLSWKFDSYCEKRGKRPHGEIVLRPEDMQSLHIIRGHIAQYLIPTPVDISLPSTLTKCFDAPLAHLEDDALNYFEHNLENHPIYDTFGREIHIPENSFVFMYKDENQRHIFDSKYFVKERAWRLPYIQHTLLNSHCVFERIHKVDNRKIDRMYLAAFCENNGSTKQIVYFAVIVLANRKHGEIAEFKTAFPLVGEYGLCRRLSGGYQLAIPEKK